MLCLHGRPPHRECPHCPSVPEDRSPHCGSLYMIFFFINLFIYFIYFWLCWVFVSVRGLSPAAASGGHSSSRCAGLSLSRPLLLRSRGSRRTGSVIVAHGPSRSAACGILPDQGSNPCPLHWQADSQPLRHQGSPCGSLYILPAKVLGRKSLSGTFQIPREGPGGLRAGDLASHSRVQSGFRLLPRSTQEGCFHRFLWGCFPPCAPAMGCAPWCSHGPCHAGLSSWRKTKGRE